MWWLLFSGGGGETQLSEEKERERESSIDADVSVGAFHSNAMVMKLYGFEFHSWKIHVAQKSEGERLAPNFSPALQFVWNKK